MKSLGFIFGVNDFRYVYLDGSKQQPNLLVHKKINLLQTEYAPDILSDMESRLELIVDNIKPDVIAYKTTLGLSTNKQLSKTYYSQAVLNLVSKRHNITIHRILTASIVPSKFNVEKDTDLYEYIDQKFGTHPPYWDKTTKTALLAAWIVMV